jgi:4-amino-4-deoxy-L-arabinose transferase-like glycosyltransferase
MSMGDFFKFIGRNRGKTILILSMLLYFVFTGLSMDAHWVMDEFFYVKSAEAILENSVPTFNGGIGREQSSGVLHSPLISYLIALSFSAFGINEVASRLVPVILNSFTLWLLYLILTKLYKKPTYVALIIFSIHPFVIRSSLLVDINGALLTLLFVFFIWVFTSYWKTEDFRGLLILGLAFGLIPLGKFEGTVTLGFSVFLFYWMYRNLSYALKRTSMIFLIGGCFFLIVWSVYTQVFAQSFLEPFREAFTTVVDNVSSTPYLIVQLWAIVRIISWFTPFIFILLWFPIKERVLNYIRFRRVGLVDFLIIFSLVTLTFYAVVISAPYGFPKYLTIVLVVFLLLIDKAKFELHVPLLVVSFVYFLLFLKDSYLYEVIYMNISIMSMIVWLSFHFVQMFVPFIFFFAFKTGWRNISMTVFLGLILSVSIVQSSADYATIYYYGEEGMIRAAEFVRANSDSSDNIIAPFDLGVYSQRRFVRAEHFLWQHTIDRSYLDRNNIKYVVVREKYFRYHEGLRLELESLAFSKHIFGVFIIYDVRALR